MTKICHMTSVHSSNDVRIFHKECTSLAKAGYDTYLVARGESREENGVHVVGIGQPSGGRLSRITSFSKKIYKKALALDADIYHLHDPELLPFGLKLKKEGKKVIFDSHERYTEQLRTKPYLPKWISSVLSALYRQYEDHVLKKIDAVVFPCTISGTNPFSDKCKRAVTVDNYPLLDEIYAHYRSDIPQNDRSICYVGALTEERGITDLIKASDAADSTVYLAGNFQPTEYRDACRGMKESRCVKYVGELNRNQIGKLLFKSRIGAATILNVGQYNKYDNMATKTYEYMSAGLPVILTRAPYNEAMIRKYGFGICVDPTDEHEFAGAIRELLDNPDKAYEMGQNGRKAVEKEFNWSTQEKILLELYKQLTEE